jgi:nickel-type superoxide dismutase maturation protease
MFPTLKEGDVIFYDPRAYKQQFPQTGDIIIALHPARPDLKIVKRVENVTGDGRVFITGDNTAETTDSWNFGHVPIDEILGRVTSRLP